VLEPEGAGRTEERDKESILNKKSVNVIKNDARIVFGTLWLFQ